MAVLSSGGLSDEQRGRLVIHRPKMEPAIIDLPPGYAHSETCVAADGDGITVVAEAVSSDPRRLEVLLYRPE